jgi:hypothetical protein
MLDSILRHLRRAWYDTAVHYEMRHLWLVRLTESPEYADRFERHLAQERAELQRRRDLGIPWWA